MSYEAARSYIAAIVQANWSEALLPTEWQGHERGTASKWGRWSIQDGTARPGALGGQMTRSVGILTLQVFLPDNAGVTLASQCADALAAIFDYKQFTSSWGSPARPMHLRFSTVSKIDAGIRDGQQQFNLQVQFERDTVVA